MHNFGSHVHKSNRKLQCQLCSSWVLLRLALSSFVDIVCEHENHKCTICGSHVHKSNRKLQCQLCSSWVLLRLALSSFVDIVWLLFLPLVDLQADEFFQAIGVTDCSLKMNLVRNCRYKFNLNSFENLDDGFFDNIEIDADRNYYNINSNIIND